MQKAVLPGLLAVALAVPSCGSPPPPAPPPAVPSKPVAVQAPPPPELSAVPAPAGLVVYGRVNKPEAALKTVGAWTGLPMPGADAVAELVTGAQVGRLVDLGQPIDFAVVVGGDVRSPDPKIAVSVAVKSLEEARGVLGDKNTLTAKGDVIRISGPDFDEEHPCSLAPAFGAAATRLVCTTGTGSEEALLPWITRTAPREAFSSDLHVSLRMPALRPFVKQMRAMAPALLSNLLDSGGGAPAVSQMAEAVIGEAADVSEDMQELAFDVGLADASADAKATATFGKSTSLLARLALGHPELAGPPPAAFLRLPADADDANFTRGMPASDIAHARSLLHGLFLAALEKKGLGEADGKPVVDAVMRFADLFTGPIVYAKGLDMAHIDKARAALDRASDAGRKDAETAFMAELSGWSVLQAHEPVAKVSQVGQDLAKALARPGFAKWAKDMLHGAPPHSAKMIALPKNANLPAGSIHLEVTVYDAPLPVEPPPNAKPGKAAAKPKYGPVLKPRKVHMVAVPEGDSTWLAMSPDFELALAKARVVVPGAPDAGTLAKRGDLDALKGAVASTGGFVSMRGLMTPTPLRFIIGATSVPHGPLFEGLANTKTQGATPIVFFSTPGAAPASDGAGSVVLTATVPRPALGEIMKVLARHL